MKSVLFYVAGIGVALATLPLGLWSMVIVAVFCFGVGTLIGMFDWREFIKNPSGF